MDEIEEKYYKDLVVKKSFNYDKIMKSINIVQQYVSKKHIIIVGGQSIDYVLKMNGGVGIYDKDMIPDIDIISDTHFEHAYAIALLLKKSGITGISVINALHPTTMKVRVDFLEVCDITYIPTHIIDIVPTMFYKGYKISHPYYQYVDQHRSFSYPLENPPFETVVNRWEKDMTRYDLLYEYYPLHIKNIDNTLIGIGLPTKLSIDKLNNQCISGFAALNYWLGEANKMGFKTNSDFGSITFDDGLMECATPLESYGLTIYSDNVQELTNILQIKEADANFYTRLLDKFPRKILVSGKYQLFDNKQKIAAHILEFGNNKIYIANVQSIMFYLVAHYILAMKVKEQTIRDKRFYVFYKAYMTCKYMFIWASREFIKPNIDKKRKDRLLTFMPSIITYGVYNINASFALRQHNFSVRNGDAPKTEKLMYKQPFHVYDDDMQYGKIPKKYMEFNKLESEAFMIGGTRMKSFLEKNDISGL